MNNNDAIEFIEELKNKAKNALNILYDRSNLSEVNNNSYLQGRKDTYEIILNHIEKFEKPQKPQTDEWLQGNK